MLAALAKATLLIGALVGSFAWGVAAQRYTIFPFPQLRDLHAQFFDGPWSIGIYTGIQPFQLSSPPDVKNPVLTANDVTDVDAQYVADPFLYRRNDGWYMFFEVKNRATKQGDIAYARSADGTAWQYGGVVLDEPHHLSYPQVFDWAGTTYMVPESGEASAVRLYRATSFPDRWEAVGDLITGPHYVDPTLFRHADRWWMFVSSPDNDLLRLYFSNELASGWKPHPRNPLIIGNPNIARPAGRVVEHEGRLFRVTQDDFPLYGLQVYVFEIKRLTETDYEEVPVSADPLVGASGYGWNAAGMHHADIVRDGPGWRAAVDGRSR
jgi:hypothetical protein